jgi:Uma2 family endonuclease
MNARAFASPHLFTVAEYYRMADVGILKEDDRVELIEGEIVEMSPIGSRHGGCVDKLNRLLSDALREKPFQIRVQGAVRLSRFSEPQPDIALLHARADFYMESQPIASDIVLVIEVADSSLMYDRHTKIPLYLRSGIPEVWLVDLANHAIELHTAAGVVHFRAGDTAVSTVIPELQIAVASLGV